MSHKDYTVEILEMEDVKVEIVIQGERGCSSTVKTLRAYASSKKLSSSSWMRNPPI